MCDMGRMRAIAIAASSCVLLAACSSTEHSVAIVVPRAAAAKARALAAYIAFAKKLDAARLRAARQGAAAYQREIDAERKSAASDPSIAARDAAGFSESCNAR
jgi:hypothetical protein